MKFSGYLIGGSLLAACSYLFFYLDKELALERALADPVKTSAVFVSARCAENVEFNRIMKSVMYLTYNHLTLENNKASKHEATTFMTFDSLAACNDALKATNEKREGRYVWYERSNPTKVTFDLSHASSQANGQRAFLWIACLIAVCLFVVGISDQKRNYSRKKFRKK
jgi:hypothetical protein